MAIDFPNSPTTGQIYTVSDKSWIWDGSVWKAYGASLSPTVLKVDSTNSRVGVNNQSPTTALDVTGVATATSFAQGTDYLSPYNGFRNAIINGDFRINQRAWSSSTADGTYGFDRWAQSNSGGTVTMSTQAFTVGSPAVAGYETPNYLRIVTSGQSTSGHYAGFFQHIEDVRTFANSTITVSFWAKASSGTPKISLENTQFFGSGGSPSSFVQTPVGAVTISTSWTRYSFTFTPPSISGKTIGTTANTSSLRLFFFVSAGSSLNTVASSIGIQNNTFDFWGVQVERGSVATPFEQRPIGTELALCQRYYTRIEVGSGYGLIGFADSTSTAVCATSFPEMRVSPTATYTGSYEIRRPGVASTAVSSFTSSISRMGIRSNVTCSATTLTQGNGVILTYASGTPAIELSSEF